MERSILLYTEFKTLVIRMLKYLRGRTNKFSEKFNRVVVSIKKDIKIIKKQSAMKK